MRGLQSESGWKALSVSAALSDEVPPKLSGDESNCESKNNKSESVM